MTIRITRTSEEFKQEVEQDKEHRKALKNSRYCPECGKWQLLRFKNQVAIHSFSIFAPPQTKTVYKYSCICGCKWIYEKDNKS